MRPSRGRSRSRIAALGALLAVVALAARLPALVEAVFVVPLVFFLPGAALAEAVGVSSSADLPFARPLIAVMASIVAVVLGGLLLNAAVSLDRLAWTAWLGGVTIIGALVAEVRTPVDAGDAVPHGTGRRRFRLVRGNIVAGAVALLLAAAAVAYTEITASRAYEKPIVALSLVRFQGTAGQPAQVRVMLRSQSGSRSTYVVTVSGIAGGTQSLVVPIGDNQSWSESESVSSGIVTAQVIRQSDRSVIRSASIETGSR